MSGRRNVLRGSEGAAPGSMTRSPFFSKGAIRPAAAALAALGFAMAECDADGESPGSFGASWVSYVAGAGVPLAYRNPAAALGEPARFSGAGVDPGVVSPFQAAFMPDEVVGIGPGGSLVLAFDADVTDDPANPFGVDLIVFGNAFFADLDHPEGVFAGLFSEGGEIDVSEDGVTWHTVPGAAADGMFPTLGFLDAAPYDRVAGAVPSDFTRPVDPAAALEIVVGTTYEELLALYDGAGGGTGIDLASAGVTKARFVRIRVPLGACCTAEVDAISAVVAQAPRYEAADLDHDGLVNGADLTIVLGMWATGGGLPNGSSADLDGNGSVDGGDLTILLGEWS